MKIRHRAPNYFLFGTQDIVVGGSANAGGSWYAMIGGVSLLDGPVAPR
jgi:hypothetical protein